MSNLIITIISIALIAVVAIMAIWYGGAALTAAQAKSTANQLISQAQQIATAWQLYSSNNGGSQQLTYADWGCNSASDANNDLVPNYLSQFPTPPSLGPVHMPSFWPWKPTTGGTTQFGTSACGNPPVWQQVYSSYAFGTGWTPGTGYSKNNNSVIIYYWINSSFNSTSTYEYKVCQWIHNLASGNNSLIAPVTSWDNAHITQFFSISASTTPFDCSGFYYSSFIFYYRVFPDIP